MKAHNDEFEENGFWDLFELCGWYLVIFFGTYLFWYLLIANIAAWF